MKPRVVKRRMERFRAALEPLRNRRMVEGGKGRVSVRERRLVMRASDLLNGVPHHDLMAADLRRGLRAMRLHETRKCRRKS